jgi:hypothetical protein
MYVCIQKGVGAHLDNGDGLITLRLYLHRLWELCLIANFVFSCVGLFMGVKIGLLTLRDDHRLRVFEDRVLGRLFGPKRDEVIVGWRKLNNEVLQNLYTLLQV